MKWLLIIQSFFPLSLLLLIKYFDFEVFRMVEVFISQIMNTPLAVINNAISHPKFILVVLHFLCIVMILAGVFIYLIFKNIQGYDYVDKGERVSVLEDTTETSVAFFVTYIIPMMMDGIDKPRGFLCFLIIIVTLVLLMRNTNLYYQNPILTIIGYKTFRFSLLESPYKSMMDKSFIAITRGAFDETKIIERKHISDNVYLLYNKN
ncbi:MAG: hypothetical protein EOM59_06215 [Clostridia bacterium]|nr:hypothetical protein [Clostridia bacterium]